MHKNLRLIYNGNVDQILKQALSGDFGRFYINFSYNAYKSQHVVYLIHFVLTGFVYVGYSSNIKFRMAQHIVGMLENPKDLVQKYGKNFLDDYDELVTFNLLKAFGSDEYAAKEYELKAIKEYSNNPQYFLLNKKKVVQGNNFVDWGVCYV